MTDKIMLIKIVKSKEYKKCILTYANVDISDSDNFKGVSEYVQWVDDLDLIDKLDKNDFMKVCDSRLEYSKPDFQGRSKLLLKEIHINGKKIIID